MRSVIRTGAGRFAMRMNRPRTTRGSAATNVMMSAILAFAPTSCTRGEAARSTAAPTLDDAGVARCQLAPSRLRPLIVEWSGADRGSLELRLRRGIVAVRYDGCELEILAGCTAAVAIAGIGMTAGGLVRADAFEEQRDSLPAGPEYDAANKRVVRAAWVALAGLGMTVVGGIAGIAMIVNGASSVRMSRGPHKKTSSSRLRVGPVLTRSYAGMDLMVRF